MSRGCFKNAIKNERINLDVGKSISSRSAKHPVSAEQVKPIQFKN